MLNFSEFKDYVQMTLAEVLPDELKDAQIRLNEVEKNNGLDCQHFFRQIFLGYFPDIVREYPKVCVNLQTDVR